MQLRQSAAKAWWFFSHNLYAQVIALATMAVASVLLMLVADRSLGKGLTANLPSEALGIAASAMVTVLIVERALSIAEERRRLPLTQKILWRIRAQSMRSVSSLAGKCNEDIPWPVQSRSHAVRRDRLRGAIQEANSFAHLNNQERQSLYDEVRQCSDVLRDELAHHQVVFSWHPNLYRSIIDVDHATLEWSAYRDNHATGQEENPAICGVAEGFLNLEAELEMIPAGDS